MVNIIPDPSIKKDVKSGGTTAGEPPKASKFHAKFLKIDNRQVSNFLNN
jgi:hypothetical protein